MTLESFAGSINDKIDSLLTTIVIKKDNWLEVVPEVAEAFVHGTVIFKTVGVDAYLYLPDDKLVPADPKVDQANLAEASGATYHIGADSSLAFDVNAATATMMAYYVYRKAIGGFTEGVRRPPVIIIKTVDS